MSAGAQKPVARRDFLTIATGATLAVGAAAAAWTLIDSLNPAADTLAEGPLEVDLTPIAPGQRITVALDGKPIFIAHRTQAEIDAARAVAMKDLAFPEPDESRAPDEQWLILIGICRYSPKFGCVPSGQKEDTLNRGAFGGWLCPCHTAHFDTSGRLRRGPGKNLDIPAYEITSDAILRLFHKGKAVLPGYDKST